MPTLYNNIIHEKCIAYKNKNSAIPCLRPVKKSSSYCGFHYKSKNTFKVQRKSQIYKKQKTSNKKVHLCIEMAARIICNWFKRNHSKKKNPNWLNKHCGYLLIEGTDSWNEIPQKYIIQLGSNKFWDVRMLCTCFSQQINSSDMGQSKINLLNNPFTRNMFTQYELKYIFHKIQQIPIKLELPLVTYFEYSIKKRNITKNKIRRLFYTKYRYKMLNYKDSQNNYVGKWVEKDTELSDFEMRYKEFIGIPPFSNNRAVSLLRNIYKDILDNTPEDHDSITIY